VACKRNFFSLDQGWVNGCDFHGRDQSVPERMDWGKDGGPCEKKLNPETNNYEVDPDECTQATGCTLKDYGGDIGARWEDCTGTGPMPTSRCTPTYSGSCSEELLAECQQWPWTSDACAACNPACNCMTADGNPCGPAQVLCCEDDECVVCDDVVPKMETAAYILL